jgi:hypothetical protein
VDGLTFLPNLIDWVTIHYQGLGRPPAPHLRRAWIRGMHRDYLRNRGYSLGYNAVVFEDGEVWEIRGTRFRSAANGAAATNRDSVALLVVVPDGGPATRHQVEAVRKVVASVAIHRPGVKVNGHKDRRATSCPGPGLYQQVRDGTFYPIVNPDDEEDMTRLLWTDPRYADTFLVFPIVTALSPQLAGRHLKDGADVITERHSQALKAFARTAGLTHLTRASDRKLVAVDQVPDDKL